MILLVFFCAMLFAMGAAIGFVFVGSHIAGLIADAIGEPQTAEIEPPALPAHDWGDLIPWSCPDE